MRRHYARRRLAAAATLALADDHMRFADKDPHQGGESANLTSNLYERSYEMDGGLQMSELASSNDAHELNA
jgi:hypothetical protein